MKILELFSGTESFSKVARERGHEVFTIDNDPRFNPSLCADISTIEPGQVKSVFGSPDVIWASPPCTHFSIATHRHWKNQQPEPQTQESIKLLHHTLGIIMLLHPKFWILENPRGRMRWIMGNPPNTVFYGAYGHPVAKPTDLWGFYPKIDFKVLKEKKGDWSTSIQRDAKNRAVVPRELCLQILWALEKGIKR